MTQLLLNVEGCKLRVEEPEHYRWLLSNGADEVDASLESAQAAIESDEQGYFITWYQDKERRAFKKPLRVESEALRLFYKQKSFPAAKQGAFNQALGKKTRTVIDATAGWGFDTMYMCIQGLSVTAIERHPLLALMLRETLQHLERQQKFIDSGLCLPRLVYADAEEVLTEGYKSQILSADTIYLDPMFPAKRKKSAAPSKRMQFLQFLFSCSKTSNPAQLVDAAVSGSVGLAKAAIDSPCKRVVVKRPDYATPLLASPSQVVSSKLLHYDVYLKSQTALESK